MPLPPQSARPVGSVSARQPLSCFCGGGPSGPSFAHTFLCQRLLTTIPFRIRTCEKHACKPCRIRTYKKTPGGPPCRYFVPSAPVLPFKGRQQAIQPNFRGGPRQWTGREITGTLLVTRRSLEEEIRHPQLSGRALPEVQQFPFPSPITKGKRANMFKRLILGATIAILACSAATSLRAQEVTQAEKDRAVQYLEKTKQGVLDATKGLSEAQWNFKAGPDRWSIAQCMEHIAAAEDYIRGSVAEKVMLAPAVPDRDLKKTDDAVVAMVPDRSHKAQAPEPLVPTNRFGSPDGSLKHFVESRAKTEDFVKTTPGLRDHAVDSPMGTKLDGYEFVLLIAAHSERHTKQILEVKADPNYPKN
jgi:hypothetical protein